MFLIRIGLAISIGLWASASLAVTPLNNSWRSKGAAGLQEFLQANSTQLPTSLQKLPSEKFRRELDSICQQRDCHASKLYWYTDLEQAKAIAKTSNKPILSLRLLGNLDEEMSCANSRLFRLALYSNEGVSQYLRDNYILHWQSVRPVPQVTIDYGDGRTLKRTLTGNSIHYILNSAGQPIDALPGLYSPATFLRELSSSRQAMNRRGLSWGSSAANPIPPSPTAPAKTIQSYHIRKLQDLQQNWSRDLRQANITTTLTALPTNSDADQAGRLAMTKAIIETPLVSAALGFSATVDRNQAELEKSTNTTTWHKIAQIHPARLDQASQDLIFSKNAGYQTPTSPRFQKAIENLETSMAIDTVRNQYLLRSKIHQWFVDGTDTKDLDKLNEKVYAQLFLTPSSDRWLGLVSDTAYSAIEGDGIQQK
jgi:hypothetical protein